ncbi:MAG TPA: TolC family protein [Polyangiaceae bacterium]|nr:TolC family protein [Polyangiaceae bacterium]
MHLWKFGAAIAVAGVSFATAAIAEEAVRCSSRVDRVNVVPCVVAASLAVRAQRHELEAVEGRKLSVSPFLPSNPVLNASVARRSIAGAPAVSNWQVSLSQELEIAGQRGARKAAITAAVDAETSRVALVRRDVAATAWVTFFDVIAAVEAERLALTLLATSEVVATAARARAEKGLIAPVDSDIADAALLRLSQARLAASRQVFAARATLQALIGSDIGTAPIAVDGELTPLAGVDGMARGMLASAATRNPEVSALDSERRSMELRADALRRARIPNPTVSAFIQNDGFNERVFGVGIGLPIPIPGLVGRTYVGEIAEAEAHGRRAVAERDWAARQVLLEANVALNAYETRRAEVAAFTSEKIARAEETLRALGQEIEAGRLAVRDAIFAQQTLIELLQANVAAKRALCIASVDLARAVGIALDGRNL